MRITSYFIFGLALAGLLISGLACTDSSTPTFAPDSINEPPIPSDYSTYTSEDFFSISYPDEWEPMQSLVEELEEFGKEAVLELDPDVDIESFEVVFVAGVPTDEGWYPFCSIAVTSRETGYWTVDEIVEIESAWEKEFTPGYRELSRTRTTIGGAEAIIMKDQDDEPGYGPWQYISATVVKGKLAWIVMCGSELVDFDENEATFNDIVRSFRALN